MNSSITYINHPYLVRYDPDPCTIVAVIVYYGDIANQMPNIKETYATLGTTDY